MNYEEFKDQVNSEKNVLAIIRPVTRFITWTLHSSGIWKKQSQYFLEKLFQNNSELSEVFSVGSLTVGTYFFDTSDKFVYIKPFGGTDPNTANIKAEILLFFSDCPLILPHDLSSGKEVEFEPRISGTSEFGSEIDSDQTGIALEGTGSIQLINSDGYFDSIYDTVYFDNRPISIYSWSTSLPITEARKIYSGIIESKSFTQDAVSFNLRDFIKNLKNNITLPIYESQGTMPTSQIGRQLRRIYGRVAGLKCDPIDAINGYYQGTGTISAVIASNAINGAGTSFLDQVSPGDELKVGKYIYRISDVLSDTLLSITEQTEAVIDPSNFYISPEKERGWRKKNRIWQIAHHSLKKIQTTVLIPIQLNRLKLNSVENFEAGDIILVGSEQAQIRRITGEIAVLEQNLSVLPTIGTTFSKYPIQSLNIGNKDFVFLRDYEIDNDAVNGAKVEFSDLAEFNTTTEQLLTGSYTFTNGSRVVTGTGDFQKDLLPRDFISPTLGQWYEVLAVDSPTQIRLRTVFAQANVTTTARKKNIVSIKDDSLVTVDCYGKTKDGTETGDWIKTGPEVIVDVLEEIGLSDFINYTSFEDAKTFASQIISLKLPLQANVKQNVSAVEVINNINETILGSIFNNYNFLISMSVLNSRKPPGEMVVISDDDVLSWSIQTSSTDLCGEIIGAHKHIDCDRFTGEDSASYKSKVNVFTKEYLEIKNQKFIDLYLYDDEEARTMVQRIALMNETAKSRVSASTKLQFATKSLGDKLFFRFERLYHRLGSSGVGIKIGAIRSVKKDGYNSQVEIDDLGNLWNKIGNIADNTSDEFSTADETQRAKNGFITDSYGIITGNDFTHNTNRIG